MKNKNMFLSSLQIIVFVLSFFAFASCAQNKRMSYNSTGYASKRYGIVKGLVSKDKKNIYIISNYRSRSRVDYRVLGSLKKKIGGFNGKVITVEGKITRIGWSGSIIVTKILSVVSEDNKPAYHITITGIADLQGFLEPYKNGGGIARIAEIIKQIKSENKNGTLVVASGDDLMGRYFHKFKGKAIYSLLSDSGLEVYAPGNHEFDNGCRAFSNALRYAKFDVLCSDLDVKGTPLEGKCKRYVIKNVDGIKIGIFSLMTTRLAQISSPGKVRVKYSNRYAAKKMVRILKEHGANIILALTHIGYKQDKRVASSVDDINIIFGGHSHQYLKKAKIENDTIIVNGGERGKYVVKLDVYLNKNKHILLNMTKYKLIAVSNNIKPDKSLEIELESYKKQLPKSVVLGKIEGRIDLRESTLRFKESGFADTINDMLKNKFDVDVVFNNSGLFKGDKVYKNTNLTDVMLHNILEYDNTAYILKLKGRYIKKVLEHSVRSFGRGGWLQVAGIRYVINASLCKKLITEGKKDISECIRDIKINSKPIKDNKMYTVLTNDFLAKGGNGYIWFKRYGKGNVNTYTTFYSIVEGYIKQHGGIFKAERPDGRITIME